MAEGYENWAKAVARIDRPVPMLIENTAGGDQAMARGLDGVARLWDAIADAGGSGEVGFCLDTCHAFASGEDLSTVVDRAKAITGRIDLVHCNNSRDEFGSGRDRHAGMEKGTIDPSGAGRPDPGGRGAGHLRDTRPCRRHRLAPRSCPRRRANQACPARTPRRAGGPLWGGLRAARGANAARSWTAQRADAAAAGCLLRRGPSLSTTRSGAPDKHAARGVVQPRPALHHVSRGLQDVPDDQAAQQQHGGEPGQQRGEVQPAADPADLAQDRTPTR